MIIQKALTLAVMVTVTTILLAFLGPFGIGLWLACVIWAWNWKFREGVR